MPDLILQYYVQGSAAKPYLVTFEDEGQGLKAFCSCPAGKRGGLFCKHVAALLNGDVSKLVAPSDNIADLIARADGSPLLEKACAHIPAKQKIQPLADVGSIKDISDLIVPLLSKTKFWSEYETKEDGYESLTVFERKMYKNGNFYKNPTRRTAISYEPIVYLPVYDVETDEMRDTAIEKRTLPYLVDGTNYGKIETAGAKFMEKLKFILAAR
ncbi:MAG: SWIM zinc finger domain-containing protein [Deltaproteobacteria bacterium]|jgi:hypothetical protein|nr:SWIM zinc finger domain-containing protein [Deltaproteobacteria bacterium]